MKLPIEFLVCEADADYGYRLNKDMSITPIGCYSDEDAKTIDDLATLDLVSLLFYNSKEAKQRGLIPWNYSKN